MSNPRPTQSRQPSAPSARKAGRWRSVKWIAAGLILLGLGWYAANELCLWRATTCASLRDDHAAAAWLSWRERLASPNVDCHLLACKLARRRTQLDQVAIRLKAAAAAGATAESLRREDRLALVQSAQFERLQPRDWMDLMADPRDDEPEIARGYVAFSMSRFQLDEAARLLDIWSRDWPQDPEPHQLRGQLLAGMSDWPAAVSAYRQAILLAPTRVEARAGLADALRRQFQFPEAAEQYREVLKAAPDNIDATVGLCQALVGASELDEARKIAAAAVNQHPDRIDLLQVYGETCLAAGDAAAAIQPLTLAHQRQPESAEIAYGLARALQTTGQADAAAPLFAFVEASREPLARLKVLEEEMLKRPTAIEPRFELASIVARYRSRTEALRWYSNLQRIAPQHRPTLEAIAELQRQLTEETRAAQSTSQSQSDGSPTSQRHP